MDPINYTSAFDGLQSPVQAFTQGLQSGAMVNEVRLKQQQQQAELAQKQQMQADLQALYANPTPDAIARTTLKYPALSEPFKRSFDMLDATQKQSNLENITNVAAALQSGRPEIADKLMRDQATALRNSGDEHKAAATEAMADAFKLDPTLAKVTVGKMLAAISGPEKYAAAMAAIGAEGRADDQAPADLKKKNADAAGAESDATSKAVKAKYADSDALLDLEKKGWDITKIKSDIQIDKQNSRIAAMNAAYNRESNDLKRTELRLKIDDAVMARDTKIREKSAEVESARSNIDNMLNTADQILRHPGLSQATGSIASRLPSLRQDSADFDALLENLDAQAFISQIPNMKGMGALSDSEGKKLGAALQSFSTKQSSSQLTDNIKEAQRIMLKARDNLSTRYGVPDTVPDTPAATPSPNEVDDLVRKYTGK